MPAGTPISFLVDLLATTDALGAGRAPASRSTAQELAVVRLVARPSDRQMAAGQFVSVRIV